MRRAWPTASHFPRSAHGTSRRKMPTAASSSTSVLRRPPASRRTGWPRYPARDISPFSGCTAPPRRRSTRAGSRVTSNERSDQTPHRSQGSQECHEIGLLPLAELQVESAIVELDDGGQGGRGAVVEVRSAAGEPAENGTLDASDVLPEPGDECPSRVGHDLELTARLVPERVDGHVAHGQAELVVHAITAVGDGHGRRHDADVERRRDGVIAGMWSVVARRAGAENGGVEVAGPAEVVVDAGHTTDRDRQRVEEVLAASHCRTGGGAILRREMCPRRVFSEHDGIEVRIAPGAGRAGRIAAERIVGAGDDVVVGEWGRTAGGAGGAQIAGRAIEDLGGIEPELVRDDQLARAIVERSGALGVAL